MNIPSMRELLTLVESASGEKHTISDVRKAFKEIGYKVKTVRNSTFVTAKIVSSEGDAINAGNVFTPEFFDEHKAAFALIDKFKGKVFDDNWRVVL